MWNRIWQLCQCMFLMTILIVPQAFAQDKGTFIVQDGAFPWYDRINSWALESVPNDLKGNGPLPQQNCSARSLTIPGQTRSITIGVSQNDVTKFAAKFPTATDAQEAIAVKNPQGVRIDYRVFNFANPPQKIGETGNYVAGLLLLKLETEENKTTAKPVGTTNNPNSGAEAAQQNAPVGATNLQQGMPTQTGNTTRSTVVLPAKASFHIYLLMGQSNMVGRDAGPIASQATNPRILALDGNGQWIAAKEPLYTGGSGIGPGIPFATAMLKNDEKVTIGLVQCAVGGTQLSRWVKGGDLYEKAVARAKAAAPAGILKGVLWHQGESDTGKKEDAESYGTRLTQMFKDLRLDLGTPHLLIVVGQLGDFLTPAKYPFVDTVRSTIKGMPTASEDVGFADATRLGDKGDNLHFSADAQKEFGSRYAEAMQKLQEKKTVAQADLNMEKLAR